MRLDWQLKTSLVEEMNMQLEILMYLTLDLEYHHQMKILIVEILKYINITYTIK